MRNHFKYTFTTIFLLFFVQLSVNASRGDKTSSIHTPIGGSPVMTGTATAIDSVELDPLASNQRDYNVRNRISFGVDMQYPKFVSRKQRVEVSVNVKQFDENNTALSDLNFKLNIAYNHRDTLKSIILDDYEFSDAYKIIFKIDTIRVNGDLATTLPENLFVQGDVFVERYSELSTTTIFGNPIQFLDVDCNNSYDGIHFSWPDFQGAEEYQLEFMHVSDYGVNGSVKPEASLNYDFRNNSTRITTSKTFYNIGLLFDRGWIAYRVRPVGVDINDPSQLIFGEWSVATTKSTLDNIAHLYKIQITNAEVHEDSLNWQYSATYAEQGKRKEVITYYDGTLRNRQAVTKVNTDNNVIVGETIYDHQGRPAVNILPTPVEIPDCNLDAEPTIKYYSDYNLNSQGEPYSKTDFDLSAIDECSIGADSMSTTNGASQYYSPSNPNQNLHQAFVPDAEGYPFQQVEYTPDNTGRINRQSGVGPNFKLGSGKESQYLYGNPNQLELNKLFGSEVGYSNHYQKNAVIDANGQVSVSYIDISGKVIATALAGEAPQNMEGLGADPEEFFEVNHISSDGSNQVFDDLSNTIIYSASFVVTSPTLAVVDYQMYTLPLVDSCLENICIDCVYELELSLKDDCGVDLLPDTLQNTTVGNFQIDSLGNYVFHEQCSDTTKFNSYNEVYLDIGKYTVSKTLKIKEEAVLSYLDLIDSSNCVLNYEDFLANEMQFIDSTACMITCDNCIDELGTLQNFITTGQGSSSEYHLRVEECKKLCEEKVSDCEMYLTLMEIDFSIGGQYAQYLNNTTGALDLNKPLSIFNTNNLLPNSNASWRNPVLETSNGIQYIYVDGNGERSKVILSLDTTNPNVFSPVPQNNNLVQYDSLSGEYYIYPEQLQSVEDFIDLFEPSWSSSLVVYHPEYCYYETCLSFNEKNTSLDAFSSQTFDDLLLNTHTFSEAQAFGFIDAGGNLSNWFQPSAGDPTDSIIPWDPFVFYSSTYETGVCAGYANNLVTKFNQFEFQFGQWYSMAEIAAYTVRCGSSLSSVPAADCYNFGQAYNGIMDTTILNGEWRILKALYMSAKQEAQQDLADCKAIAYCSSFNNCIGDVDYTPFPLFGYIQLGQNTNYYPFIDDSQPCSVFSSHLYRYKVKRFSNHDDAMKEDANSTSYELYLQTGQCPNAFSLQHLLNDLAITNNLTASNYNLNLNNFLTALFQSNNSYNNPGTIPSLEYTATVTPNTISADWIDNSNSSTFATMTLNKTVPQNWNDVTGIINLFATGPNSFSAEATYIDTIVKVFPITGTITHFNLDGCTFEQECVSNQLALDLTTVFNILGNDNNLFSTTPIDIENYVSTSIGSTIGLTSLYIENAAGVGSNLSWEFLGSGKVRIFDASVSGNDGLYIEMDQTVFEPSILSTIDGFYPMTTTGNYSFEIDAILNPGGLVPITGVMYQIHNGDTLGISTGNCDLPIPNSCQGIDYEVFADLEPLLENALINYDGVSNIDLFANIFTTPAIVAAFPFGETQTTSTNTGDSLIISAGECDIIISMNTPQVGQFENLIAMEQLDLIGDLNAQSGYNNFVFIGTFATAAQNVQDTVYVSTCFSLKECNPCYDSEVDSINTLYSFLRPYEDVLTINNQRGFSYLKSDNQTQFIENEIMNSQSNTSNCEHNYFVLNNCIDNFNTLGYPVFLEYLTYGELENNGLCDCIDYICSMLYTIVYDSIVLNSSEEIYTYIFNEIECGKCYDNFNQYQQCINNFNTNYLGDYGFTSEDIIPDAQTFNNLFSCDCADTYCELLDSIVAQNIQFETQADFSEFVDYYRNCKGCKAYYSSYLSDVESFNVNSHTFLISPMSEVLFVANNYCDCLKTYTRHINEIIDSTMQFNSQSEFDYYTNMNRVCKDEKINIQENHCEDAYTQYMDCGINYVTTSTLPFKLDFLSYQDFDSLQLCFCVDSYCSALDAALAGIVTFNSQSEFNDYIFGALNCNKTPPCSPSPASGVFPEMPTVELENDCIETQVNLAVINAQNAYNQYVDSLKTVQSAKYINHCMVTQEALYTNYNDKQHHYTLYYYDVAGNLIKTIPPEGVQLLPIMSSNDSINIQINNDRNSGTKTVFTTHRLQTRYEYNSLNQLVAQYTPDTDPMESFEETLPNGLNNKLITHKIQMINASLGYLAGSVGERGYLYKTTDGGKTWQRQHKLVGADLKKTVMIDAIYGVAIGELGTVLKTSDGGTSWDLLNTWTINGMITSLNDVAFINSGSSYEVMIVGNNGLAALSSNFTTSSPTFTVVNSGLSGNVLSVESMSSTFYCTAHDPSLEVSRFYSYSTSTWTEIEKVNTNSFTDVHFYESNKAYATDTDGRIFRNTDVSGTETHWKHRSSNLNDSIKKIRFFNEQQGAAIAIVNGNKRLLFTKDAAKTWEALSDSSYFDIAISDNNSVIAAASKSGRVSLIFPYVSGTHQIAKVETPLLYGELTSIWVEESTSGSIHIMLTDERYLRYTENGLVVNPNWEISNYNSTTGSFIKELIATTNSSGNLYGLAITNSGQAWKLKKEIAPFVEIAGQVAGSNYKKAVLGDAYFYTLSSTDLIDRLDIDPGTGKVFVGNSLSIAHHLSYHSDKLLVANNDGDISRIILMNGGTSIDSNTDQSLTIYPDRINVLKKDKVQDRLYAYGDDGLIYLLNGLGDTFEPIKNNINKNIYNAVSSDFNMCFVGEKGLAKVGSANGNVLNHFDLKLSFSQTVSSTFENTDFHGVELASNNRLYIVGEYGAFLYNPNFGDFTGNDFVTIVNQENINLWDVSELSGTGNVFISGNNGLIQKQYGSTGIVNQQLFIPSIKDIHFKDGASATIVADNFVVRTTSNGGGSWKIALPQGSIAPTATYDKVWTLDNGKSLLLGNGNTLVHDRNSGITGTAFNSTHVRAVGKGSNNDNIFIVDDLSIKRVNLSTLASIPISTLTSPAQANAIHTFTNGDHIVVGNNGLYKHFNAGGVEISSSTGISSSVNFNDVAFKDHINGIIVGDDGIYYQTKNQTISPTGYMSNTNWELKNLNGIDPLGVNNANIYSLAIASSVDILIGGENPSANSGAQYPYVRKIYDAGGRYSNRFYYDKLGRLVVSQNARQEASTSSALNGKYSYTLYDELGRVIEVGEKTENTGSGELQFKTVFGANVGGVFNPSTIDDMRLKLWVDGSGARSEVTKSYYDKPIINGLPSAIVADVHTQRQRIVHVTYEEIFDGDDQTFDHATHYSYDIHGNVETLLQDNKKMEDNFPSLASQRFKRMDYSYDLLSGNVHRMSVQNGESDQWHHAYVYDADNRIEKVYTNTRSPLTEMNRLTQNKEIELSHNADWQNDAHYYYYDHGPLARVEIGQNNLQGVDYYYNLQGWLKGVNSSVLSGENDPGSDSHPDSLNGFFGKDVFGFGLHYYNGDYKAIGGASSSSATSPIASVNNTSHADGNSYDLYNGNIRFMQTAITNPLTREEMPMLNAYKYDQLNRLKESRSYENGLSGNVWNPTGYNNEYYNSFVFDAMGNIEHQNRHKRAGTKIEDMTYRYQKDGDGNLLRNRLYHINDAVASNIDSTDIDDMGLYTSDPTLINTDNNYSYDAEGRLVKDKQEEIDTIIWTVSGKVKEIRRSLASEKKNVIFDYDAMGNRIAKHIYNNQTAMLERSTYYILDAQGNQLSMYDHKVTDNAVVYYLADRNIYGSSRLGSLRDTVNMFIPTNLPSYGVVGNRNYELSNHLGNVLAVVNDIVYPLSDDSTTILSYEVGLTMVSDYSPFGVQLDGRTIQNEMYSPVSSDTSSQTTPIIAEIYKNEFDSPPATTSPYTGATTTLDGNLSNPVWTSSTGDFTNYNSTGAGSGKSISIKNASPDTSYVTLSLDVDNGYLLDITSYSFAHRSSTTGYDSYKLVVNGIEIGTGSIYVASSGSTLQSTGVVNVSNVVSGVTGTVNVVLKLYGGLHGSTGTFRMDDFILNGYTQEENAGNGSGNGYVVMGGYRYGFQNQEVDNEIKGKGNSVNYKFRMHDPRVGRFFAVDPLASDYPHNSPYAFSENVVINAVELEGLELKYVNEENELIFEINIDVPLKVFKVNDSDIFQEFVSEVFNLVLNDNLSTGNVEKLNDGSHRVKVIGNLSEGFGSAGEKVAYNWGYESANKPRTGTEDANLSLNPDTQDMAVAYRVGLRNGLHDKKAEEIIKSAKNQQSEVTVEKDFIAVKIDDVIYNFEVLKKNKDGDWEKTKSFDNQNKTTKPVENTVPYTK